MANKGFILLSEVLKQISTLTADGSAPLFSIAFRTMNRYTKKGGRLISVKGARLVMSEKAKPITDLTLRTAPNNPKPERKNPNHWENRTRNIRVPNRPKPVKLHINNIISFNGLEVVY